MNTCLERVSFKKDPTIPVVVIKEHLIRYIHVLDLVYDKDVLDVACGTGYGMYLMSYFAKSVSGYDISKEAIEEAKLFPYKCPICLEIRDLQQPTSFSNDKAKEFDIITCFETIEHLEKPDNLI
jgi:2-polyprenyl-3-methyl-5-hydroxy-6-metoxy-1,4-benzoquinol methylase